MRTRNSSNGDGVAGCGATLEGARGEPVVLRALFVEDSPDDYELLVKALDRHGYELVHQRVQTQEGMSKALATQGWDVVLADWTLPNFSAMQALVVLKRDGRDMPLIVVSGTVQDSVREAALLAGAQAVVRKGELAPLCEALERTLEGR